MTTAVAVGIGVLILAAMAYDIAYRVSQEAERRSRKDIYASLGFERYAGTRADRLSGGTLAKLNLGLALLADPAVLLLDEPTSTPT
ncbi:ATP-binding cassette domain-containing protein [Streptomyces sp. ADMS]|uniref:ATP-binding cassette domain-containing protein n=1 Tax=Streptomyces sp. ADMS TaxID=3071415 RepID=UPI00296F8C3F|nr:ATP-binding cassette domain-containing protein [Streptomyces sp. ADMS]MDW4911170.1 ATP-binding cassette domain-containing protein [Streptomyces sp. ADMS]